MNQNLVFTEIAQTKEIDTDYLEFNGYIEDYTPEVGPHYFIFGYGMSISLNGSFDLRNHLLTDNKIKSKLSDNGGLTLDSTGCSILVTSDTGDTTQFICQSGNTGSFMNQICPDMNSTVKEKDIYIIYIRNTPESESIVVYNNKCYFNIKFRLTTPFTNEEMKSMTINRNIVSNIYDIYSLENINSNTEDMYILYDNPKTVSATWITTLPLGYFNTLPEIIPFLFYNAIPQFAPCFDINNSFIVDGKVKKLVDLKIGDMLECINNTKYEIKQIYKIPVFGQKNMVTFKAKCFGETPFNDVKVTGAHFIYRNKPEKSEKLVNNDTITLATENVKTIYHIHVNYDGSHTYALCNGLYMDVWGNTNPYLKKLPNDI